MSDINERPRLAASASNTSDYNPSKLIFGNIEEVPTIKKFSPDLIKTDTLRELFDDSDKYNNANKAGIRTSLYKFIPAELQVGESLQGIPLYLKLVMRSDPIAMKAIEKEGEINMALSAASPYVSQLIGYEIYRDKSSSDMYIGLLLFKIPEGKSLNQVIQHYHKIQKKCSPKYIKIIIDQLVDGIKYIHSQGILHRDIKPENIYVPNDRTMPAYYLDFGESSYIGENSKNSFLRGTRRYSKLNKQKNIAEVLEFQYDTTDDYHALIITIQEFAANCSPVNSKKLIDYLISRLNNTTLLNGLNSLENETNRPEINLYPSYSVAGAGGGGGGGAGAGVGGRLTINFQGGYKQTLSKKKNKKLHRKTRRVRR
jgi:serine/threonine protein kinase